MVGISHSTRLNVWPEGSKIPGVPRQYTRRLKVGLTEGQAEALEDIAQEMGCSEPEAMRRALELLRHQRMWNGYGPREQATA